MLHVMQRRRPIQTIVCLSRGCISLVIGMMIARRWWWWSVVHANCRIINGHCCMHQCKKNTIMHAYEKLWTSKFHFYPLTCDRHTHKRVSYQTHMRHPQDFFKCDFFFFRFFWFLFSSHVNILNEVEFIAS